MKTGRFYTKNRKPLGRDVKNRKALASTPLKGQVTEHPTVN